MSCLQGSPILVGVLLYVFLMTASASPDSANSKQQISYGDTMMKSTQGLS